MGEGLSDEETVALLQQFRQVLGEDGEHEEDRELIKWLKARKFDVEKAKDMYFHSKEMKYSMNVDHILEEYTPPEVLENYLTGGICGYDKEGSPVIIDMLGHLDIRGIMRCAKKSELEKTEIMRVEQWKRIMKEISNRLYKLIDTVTVIVDLEGVSSNLLWRPGFKMYSHLVDMAECNYPGLIKRIFIINTPAFLPILWKLFITFLGENMRKNVTLISGDFRPQLLKEIDADQLLQRYGGTLADDDPRCPLKIVKGGQVPTCYLSNHDQADTKGLTPVSIEPGKFLQIECNVRVKGSLIRWEFLTREHDIGFGIILEKEEGENVRVVKFKHYDCHICVEEGFYICSQPGKYIVVFDNSYSWARRKHLLYNVELLSADKHTAEDMQAHKFLRRPSSPSLSCTKLTHSPGQTHTVD